MRLAAEDDTGLTYRYCCYNVNNDDWRDMQMMYDGEIVIDKAVFSKSEIDREMQHMLEAGQVTIRNASGTWMTTSDGIDRMACLLLVRFFQKYQETGVVPEHMECFW